METKFSKNQNQVILKKTGAIIVSILMLTVLFLSGCNGGAESSISESNVDPTPTEEATTSESSQMDATPTEEPTASESSQEDATPTEEPTANESSQAQATPTPQPTQAPSNLFSDDFESGLDKWTVQGGNWVIEDVGGNKMLAQKDRDSFEAMIIAGDYGWTDYTVSARINLKNGYAGLMGRVDESGNKYLFDCGEITYSIWRNFGGGWEQLIPDTDHNFGADTWHDIAMKFQGDTISVYIDGVQQGNSVTDNRIGAGAIGLRTSYGTFVCENIKVE